MFPNSNLNAKEGITSTVTLNLADLKDSIISLVVLFSGKFVTIKFQSGLTIEFSVISKIFDPLILYPLN